MRQSNMGWLRSAGVAAGLLAVLSVASCGDDASTNGFGKGPLLPLVKGNTWTYRVTDGDQVTEKTVTVGESQRIGGSGPNADERAFLVTSERESTTTLSFMASLDGRIVRYRDQELSGDQVDSDTSFSPHRLYIDGTDEHTREGASWPEEFEGTVSKPGKADETSTEREVWTVTATAEEVTVPAGTFRALVVTKAGGTKLKTYWYVRGLGKVKEIGGQIEELLEFDVE